MFCRIPVYSIFLRVCALLPNMSAISPPSAIMFYPMGLLIFVLIFWMTLTSVLKQTGLELLAVC